jgi:hypothetical protein
MLKKKKATCVKSQFANDQCHRLPYYLSLVPKLAIIWVPQEVSKSANIFSHHFGQQFYLVELFYFGFLLDL